MGRNIKLKDFTPVDEESVAICKSVQKSINAGRHQVFFLNDGKGDRRKKRVFDHWNGRYCAQRYVGIISDGAGNRISIGSRFDGDDADNTVQPYFLQYMFLTAFESNQKRLADFDAFLLQGNSESTWDFLLMVMFFQQLRDAMRTGTFRRYQEFSHNDSRFKGRLDIPRHIRENMLQNGKIAYVTREYTADNPYNLLFLRTYQRMREKYPQAVRMFVSDSLDLKKAVSFLEHCCSGSRTVSDRTILRDTRKTVTQNIYRDYESLRITSRLLMQRFGINPYSEQPNTVSGFLFDVTALFEKMLEHTVLKPLRLETQKTVTIMGGHMVQRPDFYAEDKRLIIDAKYETAWEATLYKDNWGGYANHALYRKVWKKYRDTYYGGKDEYISEKITDNYRQITTYTRDLRFQWGGVIFPCKSSREDVESAKCWQENEVISTDFFRIPVFLPADVSCFSEFMTEFEKQNSYISKSILKRLKL